MLQHPSPFSSRQTPIPPLLAVPLLLLGAAGHSDAQGSLPVDKALAGNDMSFITRPLAPDYRIRKDGAVTLRICHNWSCATQRKVTFSPEDVATVASYMAECPGDSLHDRVQRMRIGVWQMQLLATKYVPVLANDRAINDTDGELEGRADCVDHSSNTDTYLHVLKDLGQLPGWSLAGPTVRNVLNPHAVHWTPVVTDDRTRREWSVDSWFHPNGQLPLVMPLRDWAADKKAWEPPFNRLNPYPRFVSDLCPPATAQAPP